jgi:hypothetical protein
MYLYWYRITYNIECCFQIGIIKNIRYFERKKKKHSKHLLYHITLCVYQTVKNLLVLFNFTTNIYPSYANVRNALWLNNK